MSKFALFCLYLLVTIIIILIVAAGVMLCWNTSIAEMFEAAPKITYGQAVSLTALADLLIGIGVFKGKSTDD